MNQYCDKYFSKSKEVAKTAGLNPIVKYRVFTRFDGIAALEPMARLIMTLSDKSQVLILPTGTEFKAGDTIAIISGPFQDLVELETQWLQWAALPCYCAKEAKDIMEVSREKIVMDFSARHMYGAESVALVSYGALIGGIPAASTDIGANAFDFLDSLIKEYAANINLKMEGKKGQGTTPHALIAIFKGDYLAMAKAYVKTFPEDKFVALIDYNNKEIDDTLLLLDSLGKHLAGVRIDTCGENYAQIGYEQDGTLAYANQTGVTEEAVRALKNALVNNNGEHVKVFVSSGFGKTKVERFMKTCPTSFDGIGTGSFIPKGPTATSDIFEVDGQVECKIGREWGLLKNEEFSSKPVYAYDCMIDDVL